MGASAPRPAQQAAGIWGEKCETRELEDITVCGKCGGESNRREEGEKRQQSIPRVGLRMDKLMVRNISSILFRQVLSDLGYVLVALKSCISQPWLGLVLCVLGKIFPSGKQRIPVALQVPGRAQHKPTRDA